MNTINKIETIITVLTTIITIYQTMIKIFKWYENKSKNI